MKGKLEFKTILLFALFMVLLLWVGFCDGEDFGNGSQTTVDDGITLAELLLVPDNTVALQVAGGGEVEATTVDTTGSGAADGLDFNGDKVPDITFALDVKSGVKSQAKDVASDFKELAFTFTGSETTFYFRIVDGILVIWTASTEDMAETVTLVTDGDLVTGINIGGGTEATVSFDIPLYHGEIAGFVIVDPALGTTITNSQTITLTLSESATGISLSGELGDAADYEFSNAAGKVDDTITFTPMEVWPAGDVELVITMMTLSGNEAKTIALDYTVDASGPALVSSVPTSGGTISFTTNMSFVFNETVTLTDIIVNLPFENSAVSSLTTTDKENDTLVLAPVTTSWDEGCEGDINIIIKDIYGNSSAVSINNINIGSCEVVEY